MTACVNCARALQPAWKYCIFCGTRTPVAAVAAVAPRSRPLPKRTPVPGYAAATTSQNPIVPAPAPAPLSAAPSAEPVSSEWPTELGERPSLRSALAATEVPAPTPPREDAPAPADEPEPAAEPEAETEPEPEEFDEFSEFEQFEEPAPEPEPASEADESEPDAAFPAYDPDAFTPSDDEPEPPAERQRGWRFSSRGRTATSTGTLLEEAPADLEELDGEAEAPADRTGSVNTLAVLALLIGVLACPFAALFGHLALGQLKISGERGVIPAWIAVVLGYLWLGFWLVFGVTYLATNG